MLASEMTRPHPRCFIPGTSRAISRTIEPTFWLYTSVHSAAVDSSHAVRERAGVVDQDVGAAEHVVDSLGDGIGAGVGTQVSDRDDCPAAGGSDLRRDAPGLGLAPPVDGDRRPFRRQRFGNRLADAAAAAGDQRAFSLS